MLQKLKKRVLYATGMVLSTMLAFIAGGDSSDSTTNASDGELFPRAHADFNTGPPVGDADDGTQGTADSSGCDGCADGADGADGCDGADDT